MFSPETRTSSHVSARRPPRWCWRTFLRTTVLAVGLAIAGGAVSAIAGGAPHVAFAKSGKVGEYLNDDGTVWVVYTDGKDFWIDVYDENGNYDHSYILDGEDVDPDGNSTGSEADSIGDIVNRIKKSVHGEVAPNWEDGILGKMMTSHGKGKVPVWNPGDVVAFEADGVGGGGGGFDPEGGSFLDQLMNAAKHSHGNNGQNDDGSDDGVKPGDVGLWDDAMPGPPPLVNPNPLAHGAKAKH